MSVLVNVPIWVYFVVMAVTFMIFHVITYDPNRPTTRGPGATTAMRIGSSVILLLGLLVMQPAVPVTLLAALALAVLGGYLSGKAAPPPRQKVPADEAAAQGEDTPALERPVESPDTTGTGADEAAPDRRE